MHSLLSLSLLALGASSLAQATCLTDQNAALVANNFATLFSNYSEAFANQTLDVNYTDQTDSVSWLISNGTMCPKPVRSPTLPSGYGI